MRYLRGELTESEREAIAERLAGDDEFFLALEDLEADWIDRLARGELSGNEAAKARQYLRETGQLQRLAVAGALARAVPASPDGRSVATAVPGKMPARRAATMSRNSGRYLRYASIAAGLLLVVSFLVWRNAERKGPGSTTALPEAGLQQAQSAPFVISLISGVTRGMDTMPAFEIPAGVADVEFRLALPESTRYPSYLVAMPGVGDSAEWERAARLSAAEEETVVLRVPVSEIGDGSRELALYGTTSDGARNLLGYYPFRTTISPR